MTVKHYQELKEICRTQKFEGIEYVFGDKQFKEYLERNGYTEADVESGLLVGDGCGGIGKKEAFDKRHEFYNQIDERIKAECKPEDIFESEWWNHECGLTYSYSTPLHLTRCYFPDFTPSAELLNRLQKQFNELNY